MKRKKRTEIVGWEGIAPQFKRRQERTKAEQSPDLPELTQEHDK